MRIFRWRPSRTVIAALIAAPALVFAGFGIASADVPESNGTLHLCYNTSIPTNGTNIKLIDPDHSGVCGSGYSEVTINQTGPTGATGATGPSGVTGLDSGFVSFAGSTCSLENVSGPNASSLGVVTDSSRHDCEITGLSSGEILFVSGTGDPGSSANVVPDVTQTCTSTDITNGICDTSGSTIIGPQEYFLGIP